MTNREIKKHKDELVTITRQLNITEDESLEQRLKKLFGAVRKLENLANVVGASKYYGTTLRDIGQILAAVQGWNKPGVDAIDILMKKFAACEDVYKEVYHNVHCTLQTEEMFNACVFAKWSCFLAAVAATVACISVALTTWLN